MSINIFPQNFPNPIADDIKSGADSNKVRLRVAALNIMPDKVRTEADILRVLPSGVFDIDLTFIALETHKPSEKSAEHIRNYYVPFSEIKKQRFDVLIVTGAPLEYVDYEDVSYYREFLEIADWAENGGATERIYICWAAFALIYARYGICKRFLDKKLSGSYAHSIVSPHPAMRGIPDGFRTPHSRNIFVCRKEILQVPQLHILADSTDAGPHVLYDSAHNDFLVFGHWEYAPDTLEMEFNRDSSRGLNPHIPENYFINGKPENGYVADWVAPGKQFFENIFSLAADEKE